MEPRTQVSIFPVRDVRGRSERFKSHGVDLGRVGPSEEGTRFQTSLKHVQGSWRQHLGCRRQGNMLVTDGIQKQNI